MDGDGSVGVVIVNDVLPLMVVAEALVSRVMRFVAD